MLPAAEDGMDVTRLMSTRVAAHPSRVAVTFVADPDEPRTEATLSYRELDAAARRVGASLRDPYLPGSRLLLLYPTGLELVVAFLGCVYAGMVAVPAPLPDRHRQRHRLSGIVKDAGVRAVLTDGASLPAVVDWLTADGLGSLACVRTEDLGLRGRLEGEGPESMKAEPPVAPPGPDAPLLLQYTSGSTGSPKGVVVTHGNLLHNMDCLRRALDLSPDTRFGGWIPLYHDMGLLAQLMPGLLIGDSAVLMPAATFLKRPYTWLRLVDQYGIGFSAAPNFAYELCLRRVTDEQVAGLDLSRWSHAVNGSEPVRVATLTAFAERFAAAGLRPDAPCPCYGMAEATVFISGRGRRRPLHRRVDAELVELVELHELRSAVPWRSAGRDLVSCGTPVDFDLRIVEPSTGRVLPAGSVGEIWLRGPSVAAGYWANEPATQETFRAVTADGEEGFLRTGDLGVQLDGELYVTGRLKEMLIVHGRNLYPQDIEDTLRAHHPELASGVGAAFTIAAPDERVVVTHEVSGHQVSDHQVSSHQVSGHDNQAALRELAASIRRTLVRELGIAAAAVVLLPPGGVLRTTSGKVQRAGMRAAFLAGDLAAVYAEVDPSLRGVAG